MNTGILLIGDIYWWLERRDYSKDYQAQETQIGIKYQCKSSRLDKDFSWPLIVPQTYPTHNCSRIGWNDSTSVDAHSVTCLINYTGLVDSTWIQVLKPDFIFLFKK